MDESPTLKEDQGQESQGQTNVRLTADSGIVKEERMAQIGGDNRIFNVNGTSEEFLGEVLGIALLQSNNRVEGWQKDPKRGVVLYWHAEGQKGVTPFLSEPTSKELARMILKSLAEPWAKDIPMKDWDANADHDGDNELGWRVYCNDWGHIGDNAYAFLCVKPAFLWYGK